MAIGMMATNTLYKNAVSLIKKHKLNPMDFPAVIERMQKASMRYFMMQNRNGNQD
jgi:uncharacterized protein YfeS